MDLSPDAVPNSTILHRDEKKNQEKSDEKKTDVTKSIPPGCEQTYMSICQMLSADDFRCLKMLCTLWLLPTKTHKINRNDVKSANDLFSALQIRFKTYLQFDLLLVELLYTVKRYDLLKKMKFCKHNAPQVIKNFVDPMWRDCFNLIDKFNPSGKSEEFEKNMIELLKFEKKQRIEWIFESIEGLVEKTILDDIRRTINELGDEPYAMDFEPCGVCLIINNKEFNDPIKFPAREGTETDRDALLNLFTEFCFQVRIYNDCTGLEMRKLILDLADENHTNHNCVVVCILSHGEEGCVVSVNGDKINIDHEIVSVFNSKSTLAGKPKLFFIQACQGNKKMRPVSEPVEAGERSLPPHRSLDENMSPDSSAELAADSIGSHPAKSDYLLCLSTVEGFSAYRNRTSGTWFISTLAKFLHLHGALEDIMAVMRRVNKDVGDNEGVVDGEKVKQQPIQKTTLRKRLIFKKKNIINP